MNKGKIWLAALGWFFAIEATFTHQFSVVGPFNSRDQCTQMQAWAMLANRPEKPTVRLSECWEAKTH